MTVSAFTANSVSKKYLKGLMEELGLPVPKIHDLELLLTALEPHHPKLRSCRRGLLFLSDFAVDPRILGSTPVSARRLLPSAGLVGYARWHGACWAFKNRAEKSRDRPSVR